MIPDFQTLMLPVLELAAKGETRISDAVETLAEKFELTDDERAELLPSGKQARFANRVHWARLYLKKAGLIDSPRRGYFVITARGREVLGAPPERITIKYLEQFDAFTGFRSTSGTKSGAKDTNSASEAAGETDQTPEELIRSSHTALVEAVASDLLDRLRVSEPAFFERAVLDLLESMGYGEGKVTGRSGDGGIDGEVSRDPLGLEPLYMQAKRYGEGQSVGPADIQAFYGALSMRAATTGIFFTTARFTAGATKTAEQLPARIKLIDGLALARLMVRHGVGVRVTETLVLPEIDEGYFE